MDKTKTALETHDKGFNCAQAVFAALCGNVGVKREEALKIAACFGGGMKCGEVCGAVTGALMAIGMKYGSTKDYDFDNKKFIGTKTNDFINEFKEKNGAILCRELLQNSDRAEVCPRLIAYAAETAEKMINE